MNAQSIYKAHKHEIDIIEAAKVCEQRRYGRQLGADIHVSWTRGLCFITDRHAKFLLEHGPQNGVYIHEVTR